MIGLHSFMAFLHPGCCSTNYDSEETNRSSEKQSSPARDEEMVPGFRGTECYVH